MRRDASVYLWEIRDHLHAILEMTLNKSLQDYVSERMLRRAVEREITIMGEVLVRLRRDFPDTFNQVIDATVFVRFRNRLVHLYDVMRDEEVWEIVTVFFPALLVQLDKMVPSLQP